MLNEEARRSKEEAGLVPNIIEAVKIRERSRAGNVVESDEVMTARLPDQRSVIPPEVEQRYIRKENKFYVRDLPDVVAFEDKGNKLETRSSNEQIAESMVQVARARGWEEINVRGTEAFKKEVWLEAAANGMHVRGYTPTEQDKESLAKRSPRQADRLENEQHLVSGREEPTKQQEKTPPTRSEAFLNMNPVQGSTMYPELVGAYALASAIDKQTVAAGFSPEQREIAAARARRNIARSIDRGELPRMEINEEIEVRREPVRESSQGLSR